MREVLRTNCTHEVDITPLFGRFLEEIQWYETDPFLLYGIRTMLRPYIMLCNFKLPRKVLQNKLKSGITFC